jgi:hypothetical protein
MHMERNATMRGNEGREAVDRLYGRLADAMRRSRRDPFAMPVTVAEIYQELVPYRLVRDDVGFGMNADYEHALLRLLAGEGELARLEPPTAREVILRELRTSNPNVSIYREYAGCDVWIREPAGGNDVDEPGDLPELDWLEAISEAELGVAGAGTFAFLDEEAEDAVAGEATNGAQAPGPAAQQTSQREPSAASPRQATSEQSAPAQSGAPQQQAVASPPAARPAAATPAPGRTTTSPAPATGAVVARPAAAGSAAPGASAVAQPAAAASACAFCDSPLPANRSVRFCPYCGNDQTTRPCGDCGEVLQVGWLYCVACGSEGSRAGG